MAHDHSLFWYLWLAKSFLYRANFIYFSFQQDHFQLVLSLDMLSNANPKKGLLINTRHFVKLSPSFGCILDSPSRWGLGYSRVCRCWRPCSLFYHTFPIFVAEHSLDLGLMKSFLLISTFLRNRIQYWSCSYLSSCFFFCLFIRYLAVLLRFKIHPLWIIWIQ